MAASSFYLDPCLQQSVFVKVSNSEDEYAVTSMGHSARSEGVRWG